MKKQIVIDKRFCGPPRSGNGGYACGLLGKEIDGVAEVRLLAPPPLDVLMELESDGESATLVNQGNKVGVAHRCDWEMAVPDAPSINEAKDCQLRYAGFQSHSLPSCFVCGPDRNEGDGLRIFTGFDNDHELVAAIWVPQNLPVHDGQIESEFVWAALDCPGFFAVQDKSGFALLGAYSVKTFAPVHLNRKYIVIGWPVSSEGRKHHAGTALFNEQGTLLAQAKSTWISVPEDSFV